MKKRFFSRWTNGHVRNTTSGTDIFFSKMSERSTGKKLFTVLAAFDSRKIIVMDRINDFFISLLRRFRELWGET